MCFEGAHASYYEPKKFLVFGGMAFWQIIVNLENWIILTLHLHLFYGAPNRRIVEACACRVMILIAFRIQCVLMFSNSCSSKKFSCLLKLQNTQVFNDLFRFGSKLQIQRKQKYGKNAHDPAKTHAPMHLNLP